MEQKQLLIEIDNVAIKWNKTRDPKYKDLWYKLIKDYSVLRQFSNIEKDEPHTTNASR
jgi:hypothetical protein